VGLRETKKEQTRRDIAAAAMRLFVQRGFARVTVADVAREAGVSEKTVFNYFPTKEDLFFDEVDAREAALVEAVRSRRPGESIPGALRRLQRVDCERMCTQGFAAFARLIEESPALRVKELEVMARLQKTLASALEQEGCTEVEARVAATLLVGVHWSFFVTARERALRGQFGPSAARRLRADLSRAYELLEHGLGNLGVSAESVSA